MGNIYTRPDGVRVMEVEYGWGMDMEAIHFPLELALQGKDLALAAICNISKLKEKINLPHVNSLLSYCTDVIENSKNGEDTFVLEDFYKDEISEMLNLIKKLEKLNLK